MNLETIFVIILGLSIGSFLNVLIYRIPLGESIVFPSSHCPKCKVKLKFWHNIPILSYLFLKGKCSFCNSKISIQYPIVETISAVIFLVIYLEFGFNLEAFLLALLFSIILALSVIDLYHKAVPDSLNLTALTLSIIYPMQLTEIFNNLEDALLFGGAFAFLRFYVSYFVKREAMGEGDIMIAGVIGAVLGTYLGAFAIFLSSILTIPAIIIAKERELPYIPFLATALLITFLFQDIIYKIIF
ncbi:prepilin signal peptidase PulO-like peptidase [Thiovulum sp. ES]|nr:prepilin signal peptidase PulO-like peptidase [Thiovulum sp. ES]